MKKELIMFVIFIILNVLCGGVGLLFMVKADEKENEKETKDSSY